MPSKMLSSFGILVPLLLISKILPFSLSLSTPFPRFTFAPNRVCLHPQTFHLTPSSTDSKIPQPFTLRDVPGEGDCMFLAVALATATSMGLGGNDAFLRAIAAETRNVVAQVLGSEVGYLHIEKNRVVSAKSLLKSAANGEGVDCDEYLRRLKVSGSEGGLYGGGPELTVLSNVLRRSISIYELDEEIPSEEEIPLQCGIKKVGEFGDIFKDPCLTIPSSAVLSGLQPGAYSWSLHILVVDVQPGLKHAVALLPNFLGMP